MSDSSAGLPVLTHPSFLAKVVRDVGRDLGDGVTQTGLSGASPLATC